VTSRPRAAITSCHHASWRELTRTTARITVVSLVALVAAACGSESATSRGESAQPHHLVQPKVVGKWTGRPAAPAGTHVGRLSCASKSFCVGVDTTGNTVSTWNGTAWTSATIDAGNRLTDVACASQRVCKAVDNAGNVVSWDGKAWSAPQHIDTGRGGAAAVSYAPQCSGGDICDSPRGADHVTWASARLGILEDPISNSPALTSISCPDVEFCLAVDVVGNALSWDGIEWTAPRAIEADVVALTDVSCPSTQTCIAVDHLGNATRFNGITWSAPTPIDDGHEVTSLSCATEKFCQAVTDNGDAVTWDGSAWSQPGNIDNAALTSVSCSAATSCAATDADGKWVTWNGTTWSEPQSVADSGFTAVWCSAPSECQASDVNGNAWEGPA
jgi:hypothetical protein